MTKANSKVRVVQVGCGSITGAWFNPATKFEDLEYVGLVDLNPEAAQFVRDEYKLNPDIPIYTDLEQALKELSPDAVFDCTIPKAHTPTALLAFKYGAHVLSEKPMSESLENAQLALDAAQKAGKIYTVTQNYRYKNGPRRLRAFLDSGAIGEVTQINADMYLGAHFGGFRDEMEHVLLLDMAIHTFDMARFIGGSNAKSVFCHEFNPKGSWYAHDASAQCIFEMQNGSVYNFRGSWCATGLPSGFNSHWRIIGEKGTILWDGNEGFQCEIEDGDEGFFRPVKSLEVPTDTFGYKAESHGGIIREFLNAVKGEGQSPETHAADNIESLKMVLNAISSSEQGKKITFE
jgi:predicted dehydrogenase